MLGICDEIRFLKFARPGAMAACAALSLTLSQTVTAQQLPPPPATQPGAGVVSSPTPIAPPAQAEPAPVPSPAPATPSDQPGTLGSIQKFFEEGAANFRSHLQGAKTKFDELGSNAAANRKSFDEGAAAAGKNAAEATRSAVESVAKLPTARMIQGKERCEPAANGAPDCQTAAENLCKKQGFAGGKSMDFTSAEECPARVYLSGRQSSGECKTVTFISRAMCQ
jgi:hypothetical protein